VTVRAFGGGEATGPSPVDRRKSGTKHTLLVERHGVPRAIGTAGANASDHRQILPAVLDFPRVKGTPGRPKERPDDLYADRGYDSEATRALLRWLGIEPHIARRNTPNGSGLSKVRWVVERPISWLKGLRRLRVRYDRVGVIMDAWTTLAASVICFRMLHHDVI
jgi:transposase